MKIKELVNKFLNKKVTVKPIEIDIIMVFTLLSTLFLLKIWPRFLSDALSFPWYVYLILLGFLAIPFAKIINRFK